LSVLEARMADYDQELRHLAQSEDRSRRLQTIPGVGPTTASAVVASIGSGHEFKNGRHFAAWLGLVPAQWSSGGKHRLGHITKRGDGYLRTLLVLVARAVLANGKPPSDRVSRWAHALRSRNARVALAHELPQGVRGDRGQKCANHLGTAGSRWELSSNPGLVD